MITCKVCGTQNPEGTQYCEGCGVELSADAAPTSATPPTEATSADGASADVASTGAPEVSPTPAEPAPSPETSLPGEGRVASFRGDSREASPTVTQDLGVGETPAAPPEAAFRPARLTLKRFGALTSEVIPLQGPRLVVGRFDASTGPVEIDLTGTPGAENISRRHAELYFEGGVWKVRDLGSTNGVFVKRSGEDAYSPRLVEPTPLHSGDELAFGNVVMVFELLPSPHGGVEG